MIIIIITIMLRQFIVNNLGGPRGYVESTDQNISNNKMFLRPNIYFSAV